MATIESSDLVIVGAGPAGHSAAYAYREGGGTGTVRLVSADTHLPYNRPPLSKDYLRGESEESELPLATSQDYADRELEISLKSRVTAIDPTAHLLTFENDAQLRYGTCIWAAGSAPVALPVPGADHPETFLLRSLDEARLLRDAARKAQSALVIGSGFIGCEAAASLALSGLTVTMISMESMPQQARLGTEVSRRITAWLEQLDINLVPGSDVNSIHDGRRVVLADGREFVGDIVLQAAGTEPCVNALADAGVKIESGRVAVDEHMHASAPDLYAAGDAVFAYNRAAGRSLQVEHWGEAMAMGEIAGTCAAGGDASWDAVPGFWTEIGDHTMKYAAWGDGFDSAQFVDHGGDSFTVWYTSNGRAVGVLTHNDDGDYERGSDLVERGDLFG